jgi:hypothetical protein
MASDKYEPLIAITNARGLDSTSAGDYVAPGYASAIANVNPWRVQGALSTEKGRTNLTTLAAYPGGLVTGLDAYEVSSTNQVILFSVVYGGGVYAITYNELNNTDTILSNAGTVGWTQAVQFNGTMYTNTGLQYNYLNTGNALYQWQYPAPNGTTQGYAITLAGNVVAGFPAATYYYAFTQTVTMPGSGNVQETTPVGSTGLSPVTGPNYFLYPYGVINPGGQGNHVTGIFNGTTSDGLSYSTNVYRLSTLTDEWYFAFNTAGAGTGTITITDNLTDQNYEQNAILDFNQDPPPLGSNFGGGTGYIFSHQDRMFVFSAVDYSGDGNVVQNQLWWSGLGIPWQFNQVDGVILVGDGVTVPSGQGYTGYGENPAGGISMGGTALVMSNRNGYLLFGNNPDNYYVVKAFNVGCIAPQTLVYGLGQAWWLAPEGPYTFAGNGPQYIGLPVRSLIGSVPYSDRINAVSFFIGLTWYLSFPASNFTLAYFTPTGDWSYLNYAVTAATFCSANPRMFYPTLTANPYNQGEAIAARAGAYAPSIDNWNTGETDLGGPVTATWTSPLTSSGKPHVQKTYSYIVLCAPFQQGTAQVTLTIDPNNPSRTGNTGTPNAPQVFTTPVIDLSGSTYAQPETRHIFRVSPDLRGYQAQLSVSITNTVEQPSAIAIYDVAVLGTYERTLVLPS